MIKALVETPTLDWQCKKQGSYGSERGFGRGMCGRVMTGRDLARSGSERKTPPSGYVCHRCKVPGHFIQHCPTNGDPDFGIKGVRPTTGIPKSMIRGTPEGFYPLPSGAVSASKLDKSTSKKEPSTRPVRDLPQELHCALCKQVMKDAVFTRKCCFRSFCNKCISDYIISKTTCICGATNILADDLIPNITLRETITRLESSSSSSENAGSLVQVQDIEPVCHTRCKAPSPTLSASSKNDEKRPPIGDSSYMKDGEGRSEEKAVSSLTDLAKSVDLSEKKPEFRSAKEPTSQESAPLAEEIQEKQHSSGQVKKQKNKKICLPECAADIQVGVFKDLGTGNFAGSSFSPYNHYWAVNEMSSGVHGCMIPLAGRMPYVGYTPGTFDVPFDGVHPQGYFGAQGYMTSVIPQRDLSGLSIRSMNMNQGSGTMNREGFEARKSGLTRKPKIEQFNERKHSKEDMEISREVSRAAAVDNSSLKSNHAMKLASLLTIRLLICSSHHLLILYRCSKFLDFFVNISRLFFFFLTKNVLPKWHSYM